MTGFGKSSGIVGNKKVSIEIKSVNSKQLDLFMKLPGFFREKEMDLRAVLSKTIERGKAECLIQYESLDALASVQLNTDLIKAYLQELKSLAAAESVLEQSDLLSAILRFPDVS